MPIYQCLLRGEGFPGSILGWESGTVGFFSTRWVEAADPDAAELAAVDALRRDPSFSLPEGHPRPTAAKVYLEEISEVEELLQNGGSGATWFVE